MRRQDITRRMVEGAPYEEVVAALDAAAAEPGTDAVEIAGRRLALLTVYHRPDDEVERVLADVEPVLRTLPLPVRVRWILGACAGRLGLAERYLPPLRAELQALARDAASTAASIEHSLWHERQRAQGPGEQHPPPPPSTWTPPPPFDTASEVLRWLVVARRPYEELREALDAAMALPGADDPMVASMLAAERITMLSVFGRPDDEVEEVLQETAPIAATWPPIDRASKISSACVGRPTLAEKYVPSLIAELEDELRQRPDEVGQKTLEGIRLGLERTRSGEAGRRLATHKPPDEP